MALVYHRKLIARTIHKKTRKNGLYWVAATYLLPYLKCNNRTSVSTWDALGTDHHNEFTVNGDTAVFTIPKVFLAPPH